MTDPTKLTDWRDACGDKWPEVCAAAGIVSAGEGNGLAICFLEDGSGETGPCATTCFPLDRWMIAALAHGVEVVMVDRGHVEMWPDGYHGMGKPFNVRYKGNESGARTLPAAWLAAAQRAWGEVGDG